MTRHHWTETDDTRTCTGCPRREILVTDDWGSQWIATHPGEEGAHTCNPLLWGMAFTDRHQGLTLAAVGVVLAVALVLINL